MCVFLLLLLSQLISLLFFRRSVSTSMRERACVCVCVVVDRFYIVPFSALEQTHRTCVERDSTWLTVAFYSVFWTAIKMVYLQRCLIVTWLVPRKTVAITARFVYPILCAPWHFIQSHIHRVHACLAVTCHLHFWQNGRDLLHATVVTRRWNGYRNMSQHRKLTLEKKFFRFFCRDSIPRPFNHESGAPTAELSPLRYVCVCVCVIFSSLISDLFNLIEFALFLIINHILLFYECVFLYLFNFSIHFDFSSFEYTGSNSRVLSYL